MSSGAQAQIAASQAASAQQAEAAANALAFSKEIFNYQKGQRQPFVAAGQSATTALMQLLGLGEGLVNGGGTGLRAGGGGTGGGVNKNQPTTSGTLKGYALGPLQTFPSGIQGRSIIGGDPNGPNYFGLDDTSGTASATKGGLAGVPSATAGPEDRGMLGITSGGQAGKTAGATAVMAVSPDGDERWIPSSLASFYRARGFTV